MGREFSAVIEDAGGGGAFVRVPFDAEAEYGSRRPEVIATIDGVACRSRLVRMGLPCHLLPVRKDVRTRLGKGPGDEVRVFMERIVPPDPQAGTGRTREG